MLKLAGGSIAHKTERGLVRLGIRTRSDAEAAAAELLALARPDDGRVELLDHIGQAEMQPGDLFEIHTPGGGGFGAA